MVSAFEAVVDHVIPHTWFERLGIPLTEANNQWNLRAVHQQCNGTKGAKLLSAGHSWARAFGITQSEAVRRLAATGSGGVSASPPVLVATLEAETQIGG